MVTARLVRKWCFAPLLLLAVAGLLVWWVLASSLAPTSGAIRLAGLDASAEVRFDAWERPYVEAATLPDALLLQGWLHASHRLWQMELLRRAGQGRMAELLGRDLLNTDRQLWTVGVPQLATRLEENASAATLALVDAYLIGVNAAIARYPLLPPEMLLLRADRPHWERRDVFALGALMAYQSANNMENELLRLALGSRLDEPRLAVFKTDGSEHPDYPFVALSSSAAAPLQGALQRLASLDPARNPLMPPLGFGSNGWVIAPERTAAGVPLYAFDSHDELGLPNLFYEVNLFYGDGEQLRGWSVPGLPGVINGYNQDIAWGFTNIGDTQDLFVEERSVDDRMLFLDGQRWYRARRESVEIPVAGGSIETLEIVHTLNGPLINDEPPISLAWAVQRLERPSLDSLLDFNRARNWLEFTQALDAFHAPTLNATYADVHGTIGLRTGGVLPRRGAGEGRWPLNGADPAQRWQGMVPAAEMPQWENPAAGYLAAANARVSRAAGQPLVSADNAAPYRIARIQQVLAGADSLSAADMQALQTDWLDGQARQLLPALLSQTRRALLDPGAVTALGLLIEWRSSPVASPDSAAALIFQRWYLAIAERVFAVSLGDLWPQLLRRNYVLNQALDTLILGPGTSPWWQPGRELLVSEALNDTVAQLAPDLGSDVAQWRLDDMHQVQLKHELGKAVPLFGLLFNSPKLPLGGGASTVGRANYSYARPNNVNHGATVRAVAVMEKPPRVLSVIPGGQSGHPLSAHYADQFTAWVRGELHPVASRTSDLEGPVLKFSAQ